MEITIDEVDELLLSKAEEEAKKSGTPLNDVLRSALMKGLKTSEKSPRQNLNLEKYVGKFRFGPDWEEYLENDLKEIDEELWK